MMSVSLGYVHTAGNQAPNMPTRIAVLATIALGCIVPPDAQESSRPKPLPRAHAHNDYEHARPLLDALDHGFCSVEADIYLVDGKLLVAHNRRDVKPERTLEALYLDPLLARVKSNGGRVYRDGPPFTLLVDIKANGEATYAALARTLSRYAEMLTVVRDGKPQAGAVTVVISGDRPRDKVAADAVRYVGIDGRMNDLDSKPGGDLPANLMPLVSDSWYTHFKWRGKGPMPDDERQKLLAFVGKAHAKGRRVRFWATPETVELWRELDAAGVDLINTDDLDGLARYFRMK
jgi:Glycerophosphoryl diester phosphodiesterase family